MARISVPSWSITKSACTVTPKETMLSVMDPVQPAVTEYVPSIITAWEILPFALKVAVA